MAKENIWSIIKSYGLITLGLFIYTFAWKAFVVPYHITGGGGAGFATVIYYFSGEKIPTGVTLLVLNTILVLLGVKILGKGFGAKTIYGILCIAFMFSVVQEPEFITKQLEESDKLICAIIGGLVSGIGIAIIFTQGGSGGGTDIVAVILAKYYNITPGKVYLYSDLVIIGSSFFFEWDLRTVIYGYVFMGVFSYTLDLVLSGEKQSVQILIFSRFYDEIAAAIIAEQRRGVTALHATGCYSKQESKVLIVVARKYEFNDLSRIIKEVDPEAFISVATVMGVYGKGFDEFKIKPKKKKEVKVENEKLL